MNHTHWRVVESEGQVLGALHGHIIEAAPTKKLSSNADKVVHPLTEHGVPKVSIIWVLSDVLVLVIFRVFFV